MRMSNSWSVNIHRCRRPVGSFFSRSHRSAEWSVWTSKRRPYKYGRNCLTAHTNAPHSSSLMLRSFSVLVVDLLMNPTGLARPSSSCCISDAP